jgi:hypothetical protein
MDGMKVMEAMTNEAAEHLIDVGCDGDGHVTMDFPRLTKGFRMTPDIAIEMADHLVAFAELARVGAIVVEAHESDQHRDTPVNRA